MKRLSTNTILQNQYKHKVRLKHRQEYLTELNYMQGLSSGRIDKIFFNNFINESVQLLINSIFLMESGYFDCAFYSIRQSQENINNMLYLSINSAQLEKWKNKEKFPINSQITDYLARFDKDYQEIKSTLQVFFNDFEDLIKQTHKIIHKQGLDTFYKIRAQYSDDIKFDKETELVLFNKLLSYSICHLYLIFIILDPIGLMLADEEFNRKLHFNPSTEAINLKYIKENYPIDLIDLLKSTDFYKRLQSEFGQNEEMNDAVYSLVRDSYFDLNALDMIEEQRHLLYCDTCFVFNILKLGLKVSNFYIGQISIIPDYWTSIKCNYTHTSWVLGEDDKFIFNEAKYNIPYHNVYLSEIPILDSGILIMEHNNLFNEDEIRSLENFYIEQNEQHEKMINELFKSLQEEMLEQK